MPPSWTGSRWCRSCAATRRGSSAERSGSSRVIGRGEESGMAVDMDKLVSLCRRKGFIFGSSEIYGGINGFWDYGPLGVELKNNIKQAWWQDMVRNPPPGPDGQEISMVGVDCSIIMNPKVWEASGHVGGFADQMVDCKKCNRRFRADKVFFAGLFESGKIRENFRRTASGELEVEQTGYLPTVVLAYEADSKSEAARQLLTEQERLVKKKKIPNGLVPELRAALVQIEGWKRP